MRASASIWSQGSIPGMTVFTIMPPSRRSPNWRKQAKATMPPTSWPTRQAHRSPARYAVRSLPSRHWRERHASGRYRGRSGAATKKSSPSRSRTVSKAEPHCGQPCSKMRAGRSGEPAVRTAMLSRSLSTVPVMMLAIPGTTFWQRPKRLQCGGFGSCESCSTAHSVARWRHRNCKTYRGKRDFSKTAEPAGRVAERRRQPLRRAQAPCDGRPL